MKDHDFLTQISLFQGMSHDDLHFIADSVETVSIRKGEVLFNEGDKANRAFFVKEGEVEILEESIGYINSRRRA